MKKSNELKLHDIREDFVHMLKPNEGKVVSPELIDDFLSQSSFRINLYHHKALQAEYTSKASSVMTVVFFVVGLIVLLTNAPMQFIYANLWISLVVSRVYYYFAFGRKKTKVDIFGDDVEIVWP
jgi:hypothetical protein